VRKADSPAITPAEAGGRKVLIRNALTFVDSVYETGTLIAAYKRS
jgi:hypothetical protein